jgi:hypothetical protein
MKDPDLPTAKKYSYPAVYSDDPEVNLLEEQKKLYERWVNCLSRLFRGRLEVAALDKEERAYVEMRKCDAKVAKRMCKIALSGKCL